MARSVSFHPPTLMVVCVVYVGWLLVSYYHAAIPWPFLFLIGGVLITWHGSLQHEAVHGLICRPRWLNDAIASVPLGLWLPFAVYRQTHLVHHDFEHLTDPKRDPESYYVDRMDWLRMQAWKRRLLVWHNTLPGRLLLGPFLVIGQFLIAEVRGLGQAETRQTWFRHLLMVAPVVVWLIWVADMNLVAYLVLFVLPGTSLTLLRSFAEHKARETPLERTAIVEDQGLLALLFLNNNLHYAHHKKPTLRWTELKDYYQRNREQLKRENGGLVYRGYWDIARRFWRRPVDHVSHPLSARPN